MFFLSILLFVCQLAFADPDHFILTQAASLAWARMDPIISPGNISGHVHNIMGGSCFGVRVMDCQCIGTADASPIAVLNSPEDQQKCDCTTAIVGADKSNYWAPHLYYHAQNGSFWPILNQNRIYYFTKTSEVKPFPPGLRMISGLATTRNASDTRSLGVAVSCNHTLQTMWLPNGTSHPEGCQAIAMGVYFPSCGLADGSLDSEDHFSHMAWPQSYDGPNLVDDPNGKYCPDSHPIKYPTIFMEANYYLDESTPWHDGNPLILAQGDESGLAYHADFVNGWDQQVLSDTIAHCGDGNGPGDVLTNCAPLAKSLIGDAVWKCRYQGQIPAEEIGLPYALDQLPGCNPVWKASDSDTKPACEEGEPPAFVYPDALFVNLKYRIHVPLALHSVTDLALSTLQRLVPVLGPSNASSIKPWGNASIDDASNVANLKVSSLEEVVEGSSDGTTTTTSLNRPPSQSSQASSGPKKCKWVIGAAAFGVLLPWLMFSQS